MKELFRSNDAVLISFVEALLKDAGITHALVDGNMSILEGSIGVLPRRMLVADEDWERAVRILEEADLGHIATRTHQHKRA
ncbi:MAG: DUF2007 domain-containing protein [Methyloligellaceae bacterium]